MPGPLRVVHFQAATSGAVTTDRQPRGHVRLDHAEGKTLLEATAQSVSLRDAGKDELAAKVKSPKFGRPISVRLSEWRMPSGAFPGGREGRETSSFAWPTQFQQKLSQDSSPSKLFKKPMKSTSQHSI